MVTIKWSHIWGLRVDVIITVYLNGSFALWKCQLSRTSYISMALSGSVVIPWITFQHQTYSTWWPQTGFWGGVADCRGRGIGTPSSQCKWTCLLLIQRNPGMMFLALIKSGLYQCKSDPTLQEHRALGRGRPLWGTTTWTTACIASCWAQQLIREGMLPQGCHTGFI